MNHIVRDYHYPSNQEKAFYYHPQTAETLYNPTIKIEPGIQITSPCWCLLDISKYHQNNKTMIMLCRQRFGYPSRSRRREVIKDPPAGTAPPTNVANPQQVDPPTLKVC